MELIRVWERLTSGKPATRVVEIWDGDELVGTIHPTDGGIKIQSRYFREMAVDLSDKWREVARLLPDQFTLEVNLKGK
jgi:hypothetical protein